METGKLMFWVIILVLFFALIAGGMYGCPRYAVWEQEMTGKAEFAKAEQNRRIKVEEAKANLEAQKLNAEAEIIRAEGMAKAIAIENGNLTDRYIQYLWVRNLIDIQGGNGTSTIVYIPTEGNLPLLEAARFYKPSVISDKSR